VIDITDLGFGSLKPLSFSASTGNLYAADANHSLTLAVGGGFTSASFTAVNDGYGGTLVKLTGH
jgi:hypothetical protein